MPQTPPNPALDPHARLAAARDVYLDFIGRRAALEPVDFDAICAARPDLADELRGLHADPSAASLASCDPTEAADAAHIAQLLQPLASSRASTRRYRRGDGVGHGGMGAVYRVWDEELARSLAMKVMHGRSAGSESSRSYDERLRRFLREAQITAQLDHPGIVPVHELGLDASERPFFTMKLVQGIDLAKAFALAWTEADGWNLTRAVNALLKVCEAMAFAHSRGVVHRDLKPANIMVGRFGEVFVMDWGIAHVAAARGEAGDAAGAVAPAAGDAASDLADGALTAHGDVLGTAVYMAPEQARGELRQIDARTDVYAVGALLYHLLARRRPFVDQHSRSTTEAVLMRLLSGPPESLVSAAPDAPPELISICDKAMARDRAARYASMQELAEDLRAYLELRVVRAHERGAWAELKKFVRRNRALAAASAASFVLLIGGLSGISIVQAKRKAEVEQRNIEINKEKSRADASAADALRSAELSESVATFLIRIFQDQRPENARARDITARELLDQAAAKFRDADLDPQVRERLLRVMVDAYGTLRYPEQAHPLLLELRDATAARWGVDDPRTLELDLRAASMLLLWQRPEAALVALRSLLDHYVALGRASDVGAFNTRLGIAQALDMAFRRDEAEHTLLALLDDARAALQPAHPTVTLAAQFLAMLYINQGRAEQACEVIDRELAVPREASDTSTQLVASLRQLRERADLARANDPSLAEMALRDRVEALQTQDPLDEVASSIAEHDLAANLMQQGRPGEALEHYEATYDARVRLYGAPSAMTLAAMVDVAAACAGSMELERAEQLARKALEGLTRESPDFNLDVSSALNVLARVCAARGRLDEALVFARRRLDGLAPDDPRRADRRKLVELIESQLAERQK